MHLTLQHACSAVTMTINGTKMLSTYTTGRCVRDMTAQYDSTVRLRTPLQLNNVYQLTITTYASMHCHLLFYFDLIPSQDCALLAPCPACAQVVEVAGMPEHLLDECDQKESFELCDVTGDNADLDRSFSLLMT